MKNFFLSLVVLCACLMTACGNAEIDKVKELVVTATEQTQKAKSADEVAAIALGLQAEMDKISAESGNKISFGKSVDDALVKYQEVAATKLAEFGLVLDVE